MDEALVVDVARDMLWLVIKVSAPLLLVSLIVGLIISIFQTVTSIQEQTLTFVPKLLAIFIVLIDILHALRHFLYHKNTKTADFPFLRRQSNIRFRRL